MTVDTRNLCVMYFYFFYKFLIQNIGDYWLLSVYIFL